MKCLIFEKCPLILVFASSLNSIDLEYSRCITASTSQWQFYSDTFQFLMFVLFWPFCAFCFWDSNSATMMPTSVVHLPQSDHLVPSMHIYSVLPPTIPTDPFGWVSNEDVFDKICEWRLHSKTIALLAEKHIKCL